MHDFKSLPKLSCQQVYLSLLLVLGVLGGCNHSENEPQVVDAPPLKSKSAGAPEVLVPAPDLHTLWNEKLQAAEKRLEKDDLDGLETDLEALSELATQLDAPPAAGTDTPLPQELQQQLAELQTQLKGKLAVRAEAFRQEQLNAAEKFMNRGKFVEATQALNVVLARLPTAAQRTRADQLAADIERRRRAKRDLQSWMQLLESTDRREISTAQTQLSRDVDTAVSLLVEATEQLDKPILVRNAMEVLRNLNRPEFSVPAILAVLERSEQQENWSDAIGQLGEFTVPGAGQALLDMTLSATDSGQRVALISGLSRVVDPPKETLAELLPYLQGGDAELVVVLKALNHTVIVHQQFDLLARRGIDFALTVEQEKLLNELAPRLLEISSNGSADAALAAKVLSATLGFTAPSVFTGVTVARAHAESEDGQAIAVLDGVWNSIEPGTMWRHPIEKQSLIELDLGESKIVTGVQIWNLNEPSYTYRGWKDVHIYVGDSAATMRLAAKGFVPQAPGKAEIPDYSTIIPLNFARGRFVRLVGKTTWNPNTHTGISEVQVLGF